jgi:hypothetical protein
MTGMADPARSLLCLMGDGYIEVTHWYPHPCGGYYMVEAQVWGPQGKVGYSMPWDPS